MRSGTRGDRARLFGVILISSVLLLACGTVTTIQTGTQPTPTKGSRVAKPTNTAGTARAQAADPQGQDSDGDGIAGDQDQCPQEPENYDKVFDTDGCPDRGIRELMEVGAEYINDYWEKEFREANTGYDRPREVVPYTRQIRTACGPAVLNNAFYCPRSHGIYFDLNFLQEQLDTDGDFAPVTILAHEWGHLVQGNLGIIGSDIHSIQLELQADCFAGAWAKSADELGMLEEGDLEEGATALFKAGDDINTPWFDPQAHGQPEQRIEAFDLGVRRGVDACFEE